MRIGLMLRSYDENGGIGVYTRNLVQELLSVDQRNEYVLFYRNRAHLGQFAHHANVEERYVAARSRLLWDQAGIAFGCWREGVDVVLNPKFTAPLLAPCKAVVVVHGADWFIPEQARFYSRFNVIYNRVALPLYFRKCAAVISVSQLTTDNFNRVLGLPPGKVRTVYFGPARHFKRITDETRLREVRSRYNLPDRYILTLAKRFGDGRKNFAGIVEAYARYYRSNANPHKLVVGGKDCYELRGEYGIPDGGYGRDILFPGWIAQADLPAVYSMAGLYLYPSNLEAFPIPITEAMACGTPIVTSDANGLREIAGDAALFVDPTNPEGIADAIGRVLADTSLQDRLSRRGLARATEYSWQTCAQKTLAILESVAK